MAAETGDIAYKPEDDQQFPLNQAEINDLTQDLNLSKESAQLLDSHLKEKYLLTPESTFYRYRDRERELRQFFLCSMINHHWFIAKTLLHWSNKWATSMILQNGDFLLTYPAEVSKQFFYIMKILFHLSLLGIQYNWNKYNSMGHLLPASNYQEHQWLICGELMVVRLVLKLQGGCKMYPCYLTTKSMSDKSGRKDKG